MKSSFDYALSRQSRLAESVQTSAGMWHSESYRALIRPRGRLVLRARLRRINNSNGPTFMRYGAEETVRIHAAIGQQGLVTEIRPVSARSLLPSSTMGIHLWRFSISKPPIQDEGQISGIRHCEVTSNGHCVSVNSLRKSEAFGSEDCGAFHAVAVVFNRP